MCCTHPPADTAHTTITYSGATIIVQQAQCRCDDFPEMLPHNLGFGEYVEASVVCDGEKQIATIMYFAPKGTILGCQGSIVVGPWSKRLDRDAFKTHEDTIVCAGLSTQTKNWLLFPAECVQPLTKEVRSRQAPPRYVPERLAAARTITTTRRRECFENKQIDGAPRCFCCLSLLCFTMDEEIEMNTSLWCEEKARCHEVGHVFPHSRGGSDDL